MRGEGRGVGSEEGRGEGKNNEWTRVEEEGELVVKKEREKEGIQNG